MTQSIVRRGGLNPRQRVDYRLEQEGEKLFRSLVMYAWLKALRLAIDKRIGTEGIDPRNATAAFTSVADHREHGRLFFGLNPDLIKDARSLKEDAVGNRISDDELKESVEEVLHDELMANSARLENGTGAYLGIIIILPVD